ncbi:stage V sporulation protein S [Pseudothermotoga thermarum]|uniref:Stage V sporulation protein S n=1 Tax=Pseudothermotoga thermarum DSM 5069 TaxID=688269 RepID=F7YWI0_9THEM|nr:stage V sporulation protein S [Pseudothermotoga thermarum]AEH51960.1 Stage V sporulation protein S [Pseudothermotoga thermarum DSM 5069]
METLKVSSNSNPNKVAGAIAGALSKADRVEIQAIGAGAVNQAVKAIAVARRFLNESGKDVYMIPGFMEATIDNEKRTGISFKVFVTTKQMQ